MATIITMTNQKGGVGKTTSVAGIGRELAIAGYKTLIVDFDPQTNLTMLHSNQFSSELGDLRVWLIYPETAEAPVANVGENLDLLIGDPELNDAEGAMEQNARLKKHDPGAFLAKALSTLSANYDFILIDSAPTVGLTMRNALMACDYYLTPGGSCMLSIQGVLKTVNACSVINSEAVFLGTFITQAATTHQTYRDVRGALLDSPYAEYLFDTPIRQRAEVGKATNLSLTIHDHKPTNDVVKDYRSLTAEILGRLKGEVRNVA